MERDLGRPVEFLRLLWAVDHALQSASKRMARSLGITGRQRLVIRIVGRLPGVSAGRLAEVLHVDPGTLTGVLKRLIAGGQIRRRPDPSDRRRTILTLTPKGERFNRRIAGTVEAGVRQTLAALPEEDLLASKRLLRRLAEDLARQSFRWRPRLPERAAGR